MRYLKGHGITVIFPLDVNVALCAFGLHAIIKSQLLCEVRTAHV